MIMATKAETIEHLAKKLRNNYEPVTGIYVQQAVTPNIDAADWNAIANWINNRDIKAIGRHIALMVKNKIEADANAQANTMLADDQLSLEEYSESEGLP